MEKKRVIRILEAIEQEGSINKASKNLGYTFKWTWILLDKIKSFYGDDIVYSLIGGNDRGGTYLTKKGRELLEKLKNGIY